MRLDVFLHCWAPSVCFWFICVINQLKTSLDLSLLDIKCLHHHFLCRLLLLLVCPSLRGVGHQSDHGLLQKEFVRMIQITTWVQAKCHGWCCSPWPCARPVWKSWLWTHCSLCIAEALSLRMVTSSARGVPCNAMTTAASSACVLECWAPTCSDLWGMAASCHMTPAPTAGSFVLDWFSHKDTSNASKSTFRPGSSSSEQTKYRAR